MKMEAHVYDFQIRVLLYREDGEFVAHALEMDLLGYGKTDAEALRELKGLIEAQITFARQKNDDTLLDFPAPKEFFARWEKAHAAALKRQVFPDTSVQMTAKAIFISLGERIRRIQDAPAKQFRRLTSPVCA